MGPAVLTALVENGRIHSQPDIYALCVEDIASIERMGEKSAENLIASIEKSKNAGLSRLVYALGIRNVGQKTADILAQQFETIDGLMEATFDEISSVNGVGEVIADSVVSYFLLPQSKKLMERFKEYGLLLKAEKRAKTGIFENMTFVLTGTLPDMTRSEAGDIILANGGKVSSSVSKKTTYVLAGEDAGSKLTKAQTLGVPIINQEEFLQMLHP